MSRYRDTQLQVTENLSDLQNLSPNIYQFFKSGIIVYFKKLVIQVLIEGQDVYCIRHQWVNVLSAKHDYNRVVLLAV